MSNKVDTKSYQPGDTCYIGTPGSWETRYSTAEVVRVTPQGQLVCKTPSGSERRFNARGDELGCASTWRIPFLVTQDQYDRNIAFQREQARRKAFERDVRDLGSKLTDKAAFLAELTRFAALAEEFLPEPI